MNDKRAFFPPPSPLVWDFNVPSFNWNEWHESRYTAPVHHHNIMQHATNTFSRKVFVGGLPADVARHTVEETFQRFGPVLIDWPRQAQHPKGRPTPRCSLNGYVFLVYEEEQSVHKLVNECTREHDQLFILISSATTKNKPAQVRPWRLTNIDYIAPDCSQGCGSRDIDPRKTVFVGGVPRPTTAQELAMVLSEEFGPVAYVGIDIDPDLKYPKGAARVSFKDHNSYLKAIRGKYVRIPHVDSSKKEVEVKPYVLGGQPCDQCEGSKCDGKAAPYFCGDVSCLQYYCVTCWDDMHYTNRNSSRTKHCPLVRLGDQTKAMNIVPHLSMPPTVSVPTTQPAIVVDREVERLMRANAAAAAAQAAAAAAAQINLLQLHNQPYAPWLPLHPSTAALAAALVSSAASPSSSSTTTGSNTSYGHHHQHQHQHHHGGHGHHHPGGPPPHTAGNNRSAFIY